MRQEIRFDMARRVLVLFPGTTHPVRMGSQVRTNALLRHLCEDLGWEVDLFTPYGLLRPKRWGDNWDRMRAIHIPRDLAARKEAGFTMPNLRKALGGGVMESLWRDLRDNLKRLTRRRGVEETPSFELLSHVNETGGDGGNGSPVSVRLKEHDKQYYRESLQALAAENSYDAVIVTYVWLSSMIDWLFDKPVRPKMICDTIDVQYVREARLARLREDAVLNIEEEKRIEINCLRRFDLVVGITDVDAAELQTALPDTNACAVKVEAAVPPAYLLSEEVWQDRCAQKHEFDLVFLGGQNEGNIYAVETLLNTVLPDLLQQRPGLRLAIAGSVCGAPPVKRWAGHPAVEVCGHVETAGGFLERGRVLAAPITAGGGVKVKILEAMAHGLAVVTTPLGAEGIDFDDGHHGFVAEDLDIFSQRVLQLLDEPETLKNFSFAAQRGILEHLNRNVVYQEFDAYLES